MSRTRSGDRPWQERANAAALDRAQLRRCSPPLDQRAGLEPFLDQAQSQMNCRCREHALIRRRILRGAKSSSAVGCFMTLIANLAPRPLVEWLFGYALSGPQQGYSPIDRDEFHPLRCVGVEFATNQLLRR